MFKALQAKITSHLPAQFKEIATNFSYIFALRIAQQIIGFVSFFFIVNHVPKDVVGHYQFVLSVIAMLSILGLPGVRTALLQSIARKNYGFFKIASRYCFLGGCAGGLILGSIAVYYYFSGDMLMMVSFITAACLMPFTQGLLTWRACYSAQERFKMLSIIEASALLLTSALLMSSVLLYTSSHIVLVAIALIVPALQNALLWFSEYKKFSDSDKVEDGILEYGLKTSGYQVLPAIAAEIDKFSVYSFMSAADLALYNVAAKIPNAVKSVIQDLGNMLIPKFARMSHYSQKLNAYIWLCSGIMFLGIVAFTLFIFPFLYNALLPQEYAQGLILGQILLGTIAINIHSVFRVNFIMAQKNTSSYKAMTILTNIVKIFTAPILIFFFQLWGAIGAIVLQRVIHMIGVEIIVRKYHGQQTEAPTEP